MTFDTNVHPVIPHRGELHSCTRANCHYCVKCRRMVKHDEIPEDTAHCPCRRNSSLKPCACACHVVIGIPR